MSRPEIWEKVGERLVSDCRVFKTFGKTYKHPDGRVSEFYVNESADWVQCAALAKNEAGELCVVMVNQFRFGVEKLSLEFPGGVIDGAENPVAAAERELLEETGYRGEDAVLVLSYSPNPAIQNNQAHFVVIKNCQKVSGTNFDENEEIEMSLVPVKDLDGLVKSGKIYHSIAINCVYLLDKFLSKK